MKGGFILKTAVEDERFENSKRYTVCVGANLFALNALFVRMNSHLQTRQLRLLGSFSMPQVLFLPH